MAYGLLGIALLFFVGHGLRWFFLRTKFPDLLILVAIGYLVGPIFGFLSADDLGKVGGILSTVALVVILYEGGLELHAKDLMRSTLPAGGLALTTFLLVVVTATFSAYVLAMQSLTTSLLFGLALGCTSAAIVIPMVKQLSIGKKTQTILSLEAAFTDVLTIVIFLVLVDSIGSGEFGIQKLLYGIGPKTISSIIFGGLSGLIWAWLHKRFPSIGQMTFSGEAWALLTYGLIELPHYNGVLGVFALGFTLANLNLLPSWLRSSIKEEPVTHDKLFLLSELTFLLRTFFFIYLGLLVTFGDWKVVLFAFWISLLIALTRYFAVRVLFKPKEFSKTDALMTVAMGPRGLATAVLATIPLQRGLADGLWLQNTLFAVIPMSILFTAVFIFIGENKNLSLKAGKIFGNYLDQPKDDKPHDDLPQPSSMGDSHHGNASSPSDIDPQSDNPA